MKWTTGLSRKTNTAQAFRQATDALDIEARADVDVLLAFFSANHMADAAKLARLMAEEYPNAVCLGCNTVGVVGDGEESESDSALAITAAMLPGVELKALHFRADVHDQASADLAADFGLDADEEPAFMVLADPATFGIEVFLERLDAQFPGASKFGGLVSGPTLGGGNLLILGDQTLNSGAVGLAMSGNLRIDTLVAHACRPIGEPLIVTEHTRNIIHRFDRGNPMEVFRQFVSQLQGDDRALAQSAMFVGIAKAEGAREYTQGDFLIRNIIGFNPKKGDLAVAADVADLDVIQFQLMDKHTSAIEFERKLEGYDLEGNGARTPKGALLFSAANRGEQSHGRLHQEASTVRDLLGPVGVGGFLCGGEIGPLGNRSFLHTQTSAITLFRPRE